MPIERAERYAKWMIKDALSETEWTERLQAEDAEKALAERDLRIVVTLTVNPSLPKEDEYALIIIRQSSFMITEMRSLWYAVRERYWHYYALSSCCAVPDIRMAGGYYPQCDP